MCGITGIINFGSDSAQTENIQRMTDRLKHRGPNNQGFYIDDKSKVYLGHRRLSIIDLSGGKQPLTNETDELVLVFNGEIYNYLEIRKELIQRGHRFKTETDSEVIIHLYEEEGFDCLKKLNGMFAFALWDKKKETLFCSRDRLGQKPFFYSYSNGIFLFASELAALTVHPDFKRDINNPAIIQYLILGYIAAPETIYQAGKKLEPGHFLVLNKQDLSIMPYWSLSYEKNNLSFEDTEKELERLFKDSVEKRMISHVPLGVFLSGGIDSSLVALQMAEISPSPIKTFSIGFEHEDYNELKYARQVAEFIGSDHYEHIVTPKAAEILPDLVKHYGEPYADSSAIPTYYVSKMTREKVTVALNGDGGDESFVGYDRYRAMAVSEKLKYVPSWMLKTISKCLPDSLDFKSPYRRLKRFLDVCPAPISERYLRWISLIDKKELLQILSVENSDCDDLSYFKKIFLQTEFLHPIEKAMNCDMHFYLPYDLLVKVDIATMIHSLEGRSPFLDYRLVELAASTNINYKFHKGIQKYLLKRFITKKMPSYDINRKKYGFGIPLGHWLRGDLNELVNSSLLSERFKNRGLFQYSEVEKRIQAHQAGKADYSYFIYSVLFLELWFQEFIDS